MVRRLTAVSLLLVCGLLAPATVDAQSSTRGLSAEQFDVSLTLLPDGSVDVRETIAFRFSGRTFSRVEREVPLRRLDDIIDVRASMDGQSVAEGRGEGQARIQRRRRSLRVTWNFPDTRDQTRTFTLEYRAMGVLEVALGRAAIAWTVLPSRHRYPIALASVEWRVPTSAVRLEPTRLDDARWISTAMVDGWRATRTNLARNDTATLTDAFDITTLAVAVPTWQTNLDRAQQMAPSFLVGAATILVMGMGIVAMALFRYHQHKIDVAVVSPAAVDSLPPGVGTALSNSWITVGPAQMQATLLDLARRGILRIREAGTSGATQRFEVVMPMPSGLPLHEQAFADALWPHMKHNAIDLKAARQHLARALPAFRRAVQDELRDAGFLDPDRRSAGRALSASGLVIALLGVVGIGVFAWLFGHLGDLPLLVPGAVLVTGLVFVMAGQTMSVLSSSGVAAAAEWRARRRELKRAAEGNGERYPLEVWLPVAAGFGLGAAMVKAAQASGTADGTAVPWLGEWSDPSAVLGVIIATTISGAHASAGGSGAASGGGSSSAG